MLSGRLHSARNHGARLSFAMLALAIAGLAMASPSGAQTTDPGPPITEIVPVRIHGHDSSWPPVLIFAAVVLVAGGVFVSVVFMRRVRAALRDARPAARD